jgi:hypothetical protein
MTGDQDFFDAIVENLRSIYSWRKDFYKNDLGFEYENLTQLLIETLRKLKGR